MSLSVRTPSLPQPLVDNHGRAIDYLRIAITDRCNLRCRYCMPRSGQVNFVPYPEILRYEEMVRLVEIFVSLGIRKVRVTGGEPFARRDCLPFLRKIIGIPGIEGLFVTTNGIAVAPHLDELREIGITGINLSLDTLAPERFHHLTGSDSLEKVLSTLRGALERNIPLKINTVVLEDTPDKDIYAVADLAQQYPVTVRFIEKMPFSGGGSLKNGNAGQLRKRLHALFPKLSKLSNDQPSTALLYELNGFKGNLGIIEGHSRKFCATCNKIRITPLGILKTCLYDNGVIDLKTMLREGVNDSSIAISVSESVRSRFANGMVAEKACRCGREPSMASIGG